MARQSGSGGGMMFIVILLLCLCSSSSAGVGGYFYTTGKNEEEIVEATGENFELKYQEAVRALEAEKQANLQVEVAKTDLEKAQEQLAIAKLEFEGFEFEDSLLQLITMLTTVSNKIQACKALYFTNSFKALVDITLSMLTEQESLLDNP